MSDCCVILLFVEKTILNGSWCYYFSKLGKFWKVSENFKQVNVKLIGQKINLINLKVTHLRVNKLINKRSVIKLFIIPIIASKPVK